MTNYNNSDLIKLKGGETIKSKESKDGYCDLGEAIRFLLNMGSWEKKIWDNIYNKPGQSFGEIKEQSGLLQNEVEIICGQLKEISFIIDKDGKIFPTKYAALLVEGLKEVQKLPKK